MPENRSKGVLGDLQAFFVHRPEIPTLIDFASAAEREETQLFFSVGFNFYGRNEGPRIRCLRTIWEKIHNRVTANVLNRFKRSCEASFQEFLGGGELEWHESSDSESLGSGRSSLGCPRPG